MPIELETREFERGTANTKTYSLFKSYLCQSFPLNDNAKFHTYQN